SGFVNDARVGFSITCTTRSGSCTGRLRSSSALTSEKMAVLAPIPSASDRIATAETTGEARNARAASRRSVMRYKTGEQWRGLAVVSNSPDLKVRRTGVLVAVAGYFLTVSVPLTGIPQTVPL